MLLDMLNRPLKVGDTVLVKDYGTTNYTQATVDKVARKNIYVKLGYTEWTTIPDSSVYWGYRWKSTFIPNGKRMPRNPKEVIVINEQLSYNKENWPENFI